MCNVVAALKPRWQCISLFSLRHGHGGVGKSGRVFIGVVPDRVVCFRMGNAESSLGGDNAMFGCCEARGKSPHVQTREPAARLCGLLRPPLLPAMRPEAPCTCACVGLQDLGEGRPGGKATGECSNCEIECRTFECMLGEQGLAWGWIRSCSQLGEVLWSPAWPKVARRKPTAPCRSATRCAQPRAGPRPPARAGRQGACSGRAEG